MAKITGILCQIITGNVSGAGTDGSVFLGIGGREFRVDLQSLWMGQNMGKMLYLTDEFKVEGEAVREISRHIATRRWNAGAAV